MELCEVFPAVQAAKKAVELAPLWPVAHQTLGRACLGLGEVRMVSFCLCLLLTLRDSIHSKYSYLDTVYILTYQICTLSYMMRDFVDCSICILLEIQGHLNQNDLK